MSRRSAWRWLAAEVTGHLPVVLFLTAICALAHHHAGYRWVEWMTVKLVASLSMGGKGQLPGEHGRIVAIIGTPTLFADDFGGRLPLDRTKAAELVDAVAQGCPRLLALDLDVAPLHFDAAASAAHDSGPLVAAMNRARGRGIDVVATTFPAFGSRVKTRNEGLAAICREMTEADFAQTPTQPCADRKLPGRFVLTDPMLEVEEPFGLFFRIYEPHNVEWKLGRTVARLMGPNPDEVGRSYGLCRATDHVEAGMRLYEDQLADIDRPAAAWPPSAKELVMLRFHGMPEDKRVTSASVDTVADLRDAAARLKDRAVLIGMQTFPGVDDFLTPVGRLPGPLLQAHVANTLDEPIWKPLQNWFPFVADLILGVVTVVVFMGLRRQWGTLGIESLSPHLAALVSLLAPLLGLVMFTLLVLWTCARLFSAGLWCDPLPMLVGLALHVYADGRAAPAHASSSGTRHGHGLGAWGAETYSAWKGMVASGHRRASIDQVVVGLTRLAMVVTVSAAIWGLLKH